MRSPLRWLATTLALAALPGVSLAQNWLDGFETYATNSPIEGQGGWMNWLGPNSNQAINVVSDTFARTGNHSVLIDSGSDTIQPFNITSGVWTVTAYLYLPANFQGRTTFILMNTHGVPNGPYNWSQEVHFDQAQDTIFFYGGNSGSPIPLSPLTYGSWVELRHEIDLDIDHCDVYYDGNFVYDYTWSVGTWSTGVAEFAAIDLWPATSGTTEAYWDDFSVVGANATLGTNFECPATVPNSTNQPGVIEAIGSDIVSANNVTLAASGLPLNQFGYFLNAQVQNAAGFMPPGAQGRLCIGPAGIGRYNQPGSIYNTGVTGTGELLLDLTMTPIPVAPFTTAIQPGETWYFTSWYRDANPGPTSNFTDGVCITFQ